MGARESDLKCSLLVLLAVAAAAETKSRVFITESGAIQISRKAMALSGPVSSENIEVRKAFLRYCRGGDCDGWTGIGRRVRWRRR